MSHQRHTEASRCRGTLATLATLALATSLAFAPCAQAAETPPQELTAVLQCEATLGLYDRFVADPADDPTDQDKALLAQMSAVEPRFEMRAMALANILDPAVVKQVIDAVMADMTAAIEPMRSHPDPRRDLIDLYTPVMMACIARGNTLPAS